MEKIKPSEIIKKARENQNLSMRALANKLKIDNVTLLKIENGKTKKPSIKLLIDICNILEIGDKKLIYLLEEYKYTDEELNKVGIIKETKSIKMKAYEKMEKYKVKLKDNFFQLDIIKIFEDFKENKIQMDELFALLNCAFMIDIRKYTPNKNFKKYNLDSLVIEEKTIKKNNNK